MSQESTITIPIVTTGEPAGALKVSTALDAVAAAEGKAATGGAGLDAALAKLDSTAPELAEKVRRLKTAVDEVGEAKKKAGVAAGALGEKNKDAGRGMLYAAQEAQDLQYGVLGVLNNIPQLLSALGLGVGLTGVISLLAVAIAVLGPKLFDMGGEAEEAAKKLDDAAEASARAATAAQTHGVHARAAAAALSEGQGVLDEITEAYDKLTAAVERAIKARDAERRAAQVQEDSAAALALAEVDAAETAGTMTPQDAVKRRATITKESAQKKFDSEQAAAEDKENAARAKAAIERGEAATKEAERQNLMEAGIGLFNPADLEQAGKAKKAAEDRHAALSNELAQAKEVQKYAGYQEEGMSPEFVERSIAESAAKVSEIEEKMRAALDDAHRAESLIDTHTRAKDMTGFDSRKAMLDNVKTRDAEIQAKRDAAAKLEDTAMFSQQARASDRGAFETRQRVTDIQAGTAVSKLDQTDEQKRQREEEKRTREEEKRTREEERARKAAAHTAQSLAGHAAAAGMPDAGVAELRKAAEKLQDGKPNSGEEALALMRIMTKHLVHGNTKDEAMSREIAELRGQIENMRN